MVPGPLSEDPKFITVWALDAYPRTTESAIRYAPVFARRRFIGYIWAAVTDDAVGFVPRPFAGDVAMNASVGWVARFRWGKANQVPPLALLRRWAGAPEDPTCGAVRADAESELASLDELPALVDRYPLGQNVVRGPDA